MTPPGPPPANHPPTFRGGVPFPSSPGLVEDDGQCWVTRVLASGFRLPWGSHWAPLPLSPAFRTPASPAMAAVLAQEISSLIAKQAIEEVSHLHSPGFYGRIFTVPKASGGWGPVLDLSALNLYLRRIHFRMETTLSIRDAIQRRLGCLPQHDLYGKGGHSSSGPPLSASLCRHGCSPASPESWFSIYALGACASRHTSMTG